MSEVIERQFEKMGVRAKVTVSTRPLRRQARFVRPSQAASATPIRVNVLRDGKGEYFEIVHAEETSVQIADVQRHDRHLLLLARDPARPKGEAPSKFLCGHDERAWFVAAIPEAASVSNVQAAKDALKPQAVWDSIRRHNVPLRHRDRRWTAAFVRQGEWFFIPRPDERIDAAKVIRNEPIRRGGGKPHMCQFMFRTGGERVWVCEAHPNGLTLEQYSKLMPSEREKHRWTRMMREARVFVRGAVRHADHATIHLKDWHEVVMNTETQARAMRHVAFLD